MNREILVCGGTGCLSSKSEQIIKNLETLISVNGLEKEVIVKKTGCFGFCEKGPIVKILPDNVLYIEVKPEDAEEIVESHLINEKIVERLLFIDPRTKEKIHDGKDMQFYRKQVRIALKNCGVINPEDIDDYIIHDGYKALEKVIKTMSSDDVINKIKESGLRGRGGGGFPTGLKWEFTKKAINKEKYVVCNADEGDPGAFMDRSILEGDPHGILEAMTICGYAVGASKGLIYIRAEYPVAVSRLEKAISTARERGYLGNNILGSDFSFDIDIKLGAGAFVCGEETALIHSMEGERGEPTTKPPFPCSEPIFLDTYFNC